MKYSPTDIARQYLFVRETHQNQGQRVNAIQQWSGGHEGIGQSWCAYFATMVLDLCFEGKAPIEREGSTETIHQVAIRSSWITDSPSVDDLFLYLNSEGRAHHIGIVTETEPLTGIAGNTNDGGTDPNGDRVAEHQIHATVFVAYPRD